jgi:hypothetical protein
MENKPCLICGKGTTGKYDGWPLCLDCYDNREAEVNEMDRKMEEERDAKQANSPG